MQLIFVNIKCLGMGLLKLMVKYRKRVSLDDDK